MLGAPAEVPWTGVVSAVLALDHVHLALPCVPHPLGAPTSGSAAVARPPHLLLPSPTSSACTGTSPSLPGREAILHRGRTPQLFFLGSTVGTLLHVCAPSLALSVGVCLSLSLPLLLLLVSHFSLLSQGTTLYRSLCIDFFSSIAVFIHFYVHFISSYFYFYLSFIYFVFNFIYSFGIGIPYTT